MELHHLRYFVAVAEERNFGRAARRLQLAQPPLSQQIQRLEREFGVQLFDRSRRPIRLTSAGVLLLEQARELLAQAERTRQAMTQAARGQAGSLVVGCVPSALYDVVPTVLRAYRERYPEVELSVREEDTSPLVDQLVSGQLDAGFLRATPYTRELGVAVLHREPFVAALPGYHRLARARAVALSDLAGDRFIMFPRRFAPENFDLLISACHAEGFSPHVVLERGAHHTQVGYVACGLGIALVPQSLRSLRLKGVVYKRLAASPPAVETTIAWATARPSGLRDRLIAVAHEVTGTQGARPRDVTGPEPHPAIGAG